MNCNCDDPQYHLVSVCAVCGGEPKAKWHGAVWAARGVKPADPAPNATEIQQMAGEGTRTVGMHDFMRSLPIVDPWQAVEQMERAHAEAIQDLPYKPTIDRAIAECEQIAADAVNHPAHYTSHPSGVECIQITEHMGFCLGNAVKYIWRADLKHDAIEDLRKAVWYIEREIDRRVAMGDDDERRE